MSLTTRCPSCGTTFKVVPDQLKISEGWVRCGHCADVFDATDRLQPAAPQPQPPRQQPAAPVVAQASPAQVAPTRLASPPVLAAAPVTLPAMPDAATGADAAVWVRRSVAARAVLHQEPVDRNPAGLPAEGEGGDMAPPDHAGTAPSVSSRRVRALKPVASPEAGDDPPPPPALIEDVPSALLLQTADSDESQDQLYQPALAVPAPPPAGTAEARAEFAMRSDADTPAFVRIAERRAVWRRPVVVAGLLAAALLLATALAAQVALHERDRLAASLPGLRPWLEALCRPADCRLAPVRRIDAVVIDGSGFHHARSDLYQLSIDLRSTAGIPIAMPALELTLTDADDQPLLRRVLRPDELHAPPLLPVRGAWSGTLPLRLDMSEPAGPPSRIAGYRLLAFYP